MDSKVVKLPLSAGERGIGAELRDLAQRIEAGEFGPVQSVSWVADKGDGTVEVGFIGPSPLPSPTAHLMLAMGMRKLETLD